MKNAGRLFVDGAAYAQFRPQYPDKLFRRVLDFVGSTDRHLAVDIGCGTGQATEVLAQHFQQVIGVDPSQSQLEEAKESNQFSHVNFHVGQIESMDKIITNPSTVNLVTIAQAVHWMDQDVVWKACDRMLSPGGVVAVWGYSLPSVCENDQATQIINEFHETLWAKGCWEPERKLVDEQYSHLKLPYPHSSIERDMFTDKTTQLEGLVGYFSTFSSYKTLLRRDKQAAETLLQSTHTKLDSCVGSERITIRWPLFLFLSKKPNNI